MPVLWGLDKDTFLAIGGWVLTLVGSILAFIKAKKILDNRRLEIKPEFVGQLAGDYGQLFDRQEAEIISLRAQILQCEIQCEKEKKALGRRISILEGRLDRMENRQ